MDDLDAGWKPSGRPQSTVARNFMSELDDLFKIEGGLDLLDKSVHQKKQVVSTHTQQLEILEARLRETEERLKQAKTSSPPPPARKDSQRRTPIAAAFPDDVRAALADSTGSPQTARRKQHAQDGTPAAGAENMPPARPSTAEASEGNKAQA